MGRRAHCTLCDLVPLSVAELGAERDALRHSEAELGRRLETAREVCWQFHWLLLGTYRPDLHVYVCVCAGC